MEERTGESILPYLMHLSHSRVTGCYLQCDWEWCWKGGMVLMRWCQIATFPADADRCSYCIIVSLSTSRLYTPLVGHLSGCHYLPSFSYFPTVKLFLDKRHSVFMYEARLFHYFSMNPWCNHHALMLLRIGCYPTVVHYSVSYSQSSMCSFYLRSTRCISPLAWIPAHYYSTCAYPPYL